jgi:hypothetical protein
MDDNFFNELNEDLVSLEKKMYVDFEENYPNIFIIGLPRTGSTLLYQILFNNLDISCTNNFMAKFWNVPLVASKLSKNFFSRKPKFFDSQFGQTDDIRSPHEFSWYWQSRLHMSNIEFYDPEKVRDKIDWVKLKNELLGMNDIFQKPLVHKPMELLAYFFEDFYKLFNKGIFIYIKRDLESVALSLINARLKKNGNLNSWWGSFPNNNKYHFLKDEDFSKQIAGQVYYLNKMYDEIILKFKDQNRFFIVEYSDLCKNPQDVIDKIISKSKEFNYNIKQLNYSESFKISCNYPKDKNDKMVLEQLKILNNG